MALLARSIPLTYHVIMAADLHKKSRSRFTREHGCPTIDRAAPLRFALAFPNVYAVGMASLGFQLVYQMLNIAPNASCERVFLPDPNDLEEHARSRTELFTIESLSPLSEFDVVAFSICFEMDYLNVLRMLQLANIPVRSAQRDESHPLVIAGGAGPTINPEPLADFIDAFVIGDAEEALPAFVNALEVSQGGAKQDVLATLATIPGVYVPMLYRVNYAESGDLLRVSAVDPAPEKVVRAVVRDLVAHPANSVIGTPEAEFGDIQLVEIVRGCGRQCRFCAAGYVTRPPRFRRFAEPPPDSRLGLVGAAVFDYPDAESICESIVAAGREFSVSSLRLETVTPHLARLMVRGGQKTLTIAPEAGTDRLRKVINKDSGEHSIFSAVSAATQAGFQSVKLYFMIGLPSETDEDVESIVDLVRRLARQFHSINFRVSASCFVPKPWTPFQWHPMEKESVLKRRYSALKKNVSIIPGVKFSGESPRLSLVQGHLARGNRRMGELLLAALENGGDYAAALRETTINSCRHLHRLRTPEEVLPWDHIDMRLSKNYLWSEYQKALKGETTAPCNPEVCRACGACV